MKKYNVLIADDEFPARKLLQEYVQKVESLNLLDCCSDGLKALDVLRNQKVDIVLLDIQIYRDLVNNGISSTLTQ